MYFGYTQGLALSKKIDQNLYNSTLALTPYFHQELRTWIHTCCGDLFSYKNGA